MSEIWSKDLATVPLISIAYFCVVFYQSIFAWRYMTLTKPLCFNTECNFLPL